MTNELLKAYGKLLLSNAALRRRVKAAEAKVATPPNEERLAKLEAEFAIFRREHGIKRAKAVTTPVVDLVPGGDGPVRSR